MSNVIIKERPDLIYCHRCDTQATYMIAHGSSAERVSEDTFEVSAYMSITCGNCFKKILGTSASRYSDKLDREI